MPIETELKLRIFEERPPGLALAALVRDHALGAPRREHLVTTYYDTPSLDLMRASMVLRVRLIGQTYRHAVKSSGSGSAGLHRRLEIEMESSRATPDLDALAARSGFAILQRKSIRAELRPVFQTDFVRTAWDLAWEDGDKMELAQDVGEVRCGEHLSPILEIELELKAGSSHRLYEAAEQLAAVLDLQVESSSKAERGYALHSGAPTPAVFGRSAGLTPAMSVEDAFAAILGECLEQLHRNEKAVLKGDAVEGVHQMRVAWRRFRACLRAFKDQVPLRVSRGFRDGIRKANEVLGAARDWDVFVTEGLQSMQNEAPATEYLQEALRIAERRRAEAHGALRMYLLGREWRELELGLSAWVHCRRWRSDMTDEERARSRAPLSEVTCRLFGKAHRRVRRYPARLEEVEEERLHELRIHGKRLRYLAEFLGELYEGKRRDKYLQRLRRLQSVLGRWHDAVVGGGKQREIGEETRRAQLNAFFLGWYADERRTARRRLSKVWRAFRKARPFWE